MHNPLKSIYEFFFRIHFSRPNPNVTCYLQQNPTIPDWRRRKSFVWRPQAMEQKNSLRVRHNPVSAPYIDREMWGAASTFLRCHGRTQSRSPASHVSLARSSTGDGERISEKRGFKRFRSQRAPASEGTDYQHRGGLRTSKECLLEVRTPVGRDLEKKLPTMDKNRATETARPDSGTFPTGSHDYASSIANFSTHHVASARS